MFFIIIIIISSFVVLLNCFYLNPWVLLFIHSPPHPTGGRRSGEQMSSCVVLCCWLLG